MFESFSAELKQAREALNISPEQLANKIKIDLKFLEAMEKGDFTFLPEIYVRAFLKEYARTVGLDENKILKKFTQIREGKVAVEETEPEADQPKSETPNPQSIKYVEPVKQIYYNVSDSSSTSRKTNNQYFIIGALLFVVVATAVYFFAIKGSSKEIITETPYDEILEERSTADKRRFMEEDDSQQQALNSDSLVLKFFAKDSTWIRIIFDNVTEKEYYLRNNQTLEVKAFENFNLFIGNSGGVSLTLQDAPVALTTKKGLPLKCIIDRNGVKYLENTNLQN